MTQLNENGIIDVNYSVTPPPQNLYLGKQNIANSNCTCESNYKTDIFLPYGFDTCKKINPVSEEKRKYWNNTKRFMVYSYILDWQKERIKNGDFTVSMYAYVSEDCDADFRLHLEHGCSYTEKYNTNGNSWSIVDTTKGKVILVWAKFRSNADDGKIYIMFYPNPNLENTFTQGYILFTGLRIHEGTEIYRPSYNDQIHGIYSIPNSNKIYENKIEFDDFIEY
jgi:hypothetical protein|nr:MAG TPA: hypothetical protein [Caudoviricetes sp.]